MSESAEPATVDSVEVKESEDHEQDPQIEEVEPKECDEKVEFVSAEIVEDEKIVNESIVEEVEQLQRVEQEDVEEKQQLVQNQELPQEEEEEQQEEHGENRDMLEKLREVTEESMQLPMANTSSRAIEDEEMPSMVNISSPSKIDDSEANLKQDEEKKFIDSEENNMKYNSKKEEDNDSDSVCVIDDDEEEEEEEDEEEEEEGSYIESDGSSSYHDDDDSIDMHKHRFNDKYDRRQVRNQKIGEDDTTEEDVSDSTEDDDCGMDDVDGRSDDLLLRHSTCRLKHDKERSASLQDLTLIKGPVTKNKPSVNPFSQKARLERNPVNVERRLTGKQYAHVESKVKKYIMDMNEQRRISGERRKKAQEEARFKNQDTDEAPIRTNEEAVMTYKEIRDYTEKALKEVAESEENDDMYDVGQSIENGEISIFPRRSMSNGESVDLEEMDVDQHEIELHKNEEKIDKMNGTVSNESQNNYIYERKGIIRRDDYASKPVLNGEDSSNPICTLRSLSYEEYMKGSANKQMNNEDMVEEVQDISEKSNNNDIEPTCVLRIENITSNYHNEEKLEDGSYYDRKTPTMMVNQSTETFYHENHELNSLRYQLNQRNVQFDNLRDAYQKTMSENLAMKMELDNLKKMVTYYQEQQKPISESKGIAVQTEEIVTVAPSMPILEMDINEQQVDPKLASSMTSAMSSQWSDSTVSAAISMEPPPNITNALVSDDSQNQTKASMKQKNVLSRAFLTSSKILQTLSNLTYGKPKVNKYGIKDSKINSVDTPQSSPSQNEPSNSKKRKATDTLEISSTAQPFKIPNISKSVPEKNQESPKTPFINPNAEKDKDDTTIETNDNEDEVQQGDDDVKVYVYPEDENGTENSFLIQAKEVTNNSKPGVRECGPYLLGNVEVYMTEVNGTINIWGKELSQISTSQNNEELDTSTKSKDLKSNFRWQSTPRIFNNHISASTSKKSKIMPRFTHRHSHQHQHSCDINNTLIECDHCNSHNHRLSWPSCNQSIHESHTNCCSPTVRTKEAHYGCCRRDERQNIGITCCKSQNYRNIRGCSLPNFCQDNIHSPCCCNNHNNRYKNASQDELHRHPACVRRHSFNPTDDEDNDSEDEENAQNISKSQQTLVDNNSTHSCSNSNSMPTCSNNRKSVGGNSSNQSPCQNENDPLICQRQVPEAPEIRKRKLNGKRVRGILLDLLKGCGDCRTTNPIAKTNPHQNASMYEPSTSAHYRPACPVNQQNCSVCTNEKCSECRHKDSETAEIVAQMEFIRIEIEKLRNHANTLQKMFDAKNEDITN